MLVPLLGVTAVSVLRALIVTNGAAGSLAQQERINAAATSLHENVGDFARDGLVVLVESRSGRLGRRRAHSSRGRCRLWRGRDIDWHEPLMRSPHSPLHDRLGRLMQGIDRH